mgnify:CR=1 FL=1
MRTTSSGNWTMYSPFKLNMTTMVKSRAISVIGLIFGMKTSWYQVTLLIRIKVKRVTIPARNGMPR